DAFPQRLAVVQVIRNDCSVLLRDLDCLARNRESAFRERTKDSSGVKPARAFFAEDLFPIDVARLQLRHRRMSSIRTTNSAAHAKSTFGEIQSIADCPSDAIVRNPTDM